MKKLLSFFAISTVVVGNSMPLLACRHKGDNDNNNDIPEKLRNMINTTGLLTKITLLARHENLNFNPSELVRSLYAPAAYWKSIPSIYTYNNQKINLSKLIQDFNNNYNKMIAHTKNADPKSTREQLLPQYYIGMYDNTYYRDFLANGFFDPAKQQIDANRSELLGYNYDMGALSALMNNVGIKFWIPATRAFYVSYPAGGMGLSTNPFYNNQHVGVKEKNLFIDTEQSTGLKPQYEFGDNEYTIEKTSTLTAIYGKTAQFLSMLNQVDENPLGAQIGAMFLNNIFNFIGKDAQVETNPIYVLLRVIISEFLAQINSLAGIDSGFWGFLSSGEVNDELKKLVEQSPETKELLTKLKDETSKGYHNFNLTNAIMNKKIPDFKTYNDNNLAGNYQNIGHVGELLLNIWKKLSPATQKALNLKITNNIIDSLASKIKTAIWWASEQAQKTSLQQLLDILLALQGDKVNFKFTLSNIFFDLTDLIKTLTNDNDILTTLSGYQNLANSFEELTTTNLNNVLKTMGWNNSTNKFEKNSLLQHLLVAISDPTAIAYQDYNYLFFNSNSPFFAGVNNVMKTLHENVLQYVVDDKYWKVSNPQYTQKVVGAEERLSYDFEYNGVGDSSVTKLYTESHTNQINVNDQFYDDHYNPKQFYSIDNKQENIAYSGLGLSDNLKPVSHKYHIEWTNVGNLEQPMWIITKIDNYVRSGEITNGIGSTQSGAWKQIYFLY
ncbi:hypothetical protein S100390_v1c05830 [Spiroplasma sp. NBRC 100390]|uniref:hypothetical protein n=1 Tax=unclassified Spiroplasma TaxID=2637901 RepID=UPI000892A531|nr:MULTISPECIES: hypothetical protein [unclassified Spiroplasma]AOX43920.1 hypothetical protein STU14_v1c05830 [Spiroplasma sp. TU-14]APE13390.1 hypothetical protein S100390_v1c05830 [Spiroplasma sp. NBRC 100390]